MIRFSILNDKYINDDKAGSPVYIEAEAMADNLSDMINGLQSYHIAVALFRHGYRCGKDWLSNDFLALDFDNGTLSKDIHYKLCELDINHLIMASKNHLKDKNDGLGIVERFHVFIPFDRPITDPNLYSFIGIKFPQFLGWKTDQSTTKDKTRYFYKHRECLFISEHRNNLELDPFIKYKTELDIMKDQAAKKRPFYIKEKKTLEYIRGTRYWNKILPDLRTPGMRHNTAKKAFWFLIQNGLDREESISFVLDEMIIDNYNSAYDNLSKLYDYMKQLK